MISKKRLKLNGLYKLLTLMAASRISCWSTDTCRDVFSLFAKNKFDKYSLHPEEEGSNSYIYKNMDIYLYNSFEPLLNRYIRL